MIADTATVQLLVADEGNRRALASVVDRHFTAVTAEELREADLYIVDDASFPQYRDELDAHKRAQDPVFCPVVLVRRDRTAITVELPDPLTAEHPILVNELMDAPVGAEVLYHTLVNLLTQRSQTITLEEQNARLEQFAETLRHELRNPLNILAGHLGFARETGDSEYFDKCETAVHRMERMIDDALLLIQVERDRVEAESMDLRSLVEDCWDVVSVPGPRIGIETDRRISGDEYRLKQLFENLFRNAVEHAGDGVTVVVGDLPDGFYVEDDGDGIPEDRRDDVLVEGYSTEESGSGLGLAVVSAVAEAHGWHVSVAESDAGGARFEFTNVSFV
ncbi:sensor histidine kinase [Halobaculum lipolyticum]|uniref:histidine kinase n=1 Tax=Halobaculum lipolyticum TaxID=3032001 RepID=A0ABD5W715_9EURY|nr:HAMP domain-containing sensor histidine kinase [Halobaculum sp. DT31]